MYLPHECEHAELAALLAGLTPRQRRVLRAYVWQVEFGEKTVTTWLALPLESEPVEVVSGEWAVLGERGVSAGAGGVSPGRAEVDDGPGSAVGGAGAAADQAGGEPARRSGWSSRPRVMWGRCFGWWSGGRIRRCRARRSSRRRIREDGEGSTHKFYQVRQAVIDLQRLSDPRYSRLIKKFSDSPRSGLSIEVYDAQRASESILDRADVGTASKATTTMELGERFEEALERAYGDGLGTRGPGDAG